MKKLTVIFLSAAMMLSLVACTNPTPATQGEPITQVMPAPTPTETPTPEPTPTVPQRIGISMAPKGLARWLQDGIYMGAQLKALGYEVDLQFANNEVETQVSQVENMVASGCKVLVIEAIDSKSLTEVLDKAKGIKVIAYKRLIENTAAVTYYVTFDYVMVGTLQGGYIRDALKLDTAAGSFNIELITGDFDSPSYFYAGAMDVLNPYIQSGKLIVPSGQTRFEQVATADWSTENAQGRFENIIKDNYATGKKLDAVMASNDSTAQGVTNALLAAGYTKDNFPIITGLDCSITSLKNILAGTQSMSVFNDPYALEAKAIEMVDAIMKGTEVPINDTSTYNNGKGIVPSFLCPPVVVTVDNYRDILIDSGYYTADQLK